MIVHKYTPGLNIQKSGLAMSFADVSASKIKLTVTAGTLAKNAVSAVLAEAKELELDALAAVDNVFYAMICTTIAEPNTVDICVVQSSSLTRAFPVLSVQGYTLVEVLGFGTIRAGNANASAVDLTVNEWI